MKSYQAKPADFEGQRTWFVVDGANKPLGRLATQVASVLRGKHKPVFTPNVDCGDHVIVINAERIALTGRKAQQKMYYKHSGYPGGLRATSYGNLRDNRPELMVELAIRRMLPRTVLGREAFRRLKVYAGATHPHEAQKPQALEV
jgi:large subunit ribosomal protein L13